MKDNKIKQGDICIYHYADGNGSVNVVEVVEVIDSDISKIKCVQVICDKSGNGFFEYLLKTGHTMNASNEYLHKIESVDRLTDQLNTAINGQETLQKYVAEKDKEIERLKAVKKHIDILIHRNCEYPTAEAYNEAFQKALEKLYDNTNTKAEAYKECIEKVKENSNKMELVCSGALVGTDYTITKEKLDNLLKELVGDSNGNK